MALQPWRTGHVIRVENETKDTKRYWIQVPELTSFDFAPGQFVTLDLPIHEKPNRRLRSYSIASWPDGSNIFELVIVLDRRGTGTNYIFEHVETGSVVTFRGPQGVFTLKEPLDKEIFFICTGTGIAPFRSMVRTYPQLDYTLIHGVRYSHEAYDKQEYADDRYIFNQPTGELYYDADGNGSGAQLLIAKFLVPVGTPLVVTAADIIGSDSVV